MLLFAGQHLPRRRLTADAVRPYGQFGRGIGGGISDSGSGTSISSDSPAIVSLVGLSSGSHIRYECSEDDLCKNEKPVTGGRRRNRKIDDEGRFPARLISPRTPSRRLGGGERLRLLMAASTLSVSTLTEYR